MEPIRYKQKDELYIDEFELEKNRIREKIA